MRQRVEEKSRGYNLAAFPSSSPLQLHLCWRLVFFFPPPVLLLLIACFICSVLSLFWLSRDWSFHLFFFPFFYPSCRDSFPAPFSTHTHIHLSFVFLFSFSRPYMCVLPCTASGESRSGWRAVRENRKEKTKKKENLSVHVCMCGFFFFPGKVRLNDAY